MPKYNKVYFSGHCRIRQHERDITLQQKLKVLEEPTNEQSVKRSRRRKFWKVIDGAELVVVLKEVKHGKEAIVITVYWRD